MNPKFKGKIINAIRKLSFNYPPRNSVKKRMKRGPATFECEHCSVWIYEGTKDLSKQLETLDCKPPKALVKGRTNMDHKEPVVPLESFKRGSWDWDEFINRLFCEEEGFQLLCAKCHDIKTKEEDKKRAEYRKSKKLNKKA